MFTTTIIKIGSNCISLYHYKSDQSVDWRMAFPYYVKKSELSPLYTNKDNLITDNYRPLSILPSLSKMFEKICNQQLYEYFKLILSDLLSAFH